MSDKSTKSDASNDENSLLVDDRAKQETLEVGARCEHTKHREPCIDRGASDQFADDRRPDDDDGDDGEQAAIAAERVGDGQLDLTGDAATTDTPDWRDDQ